MSAATATAMGENAPALDPEAAANAAVPTTGVTTDSSAQPFHSASLYVGDLAADVNEGLLFEIFNAVGPVASIRVCRDAVTRRSLGYAYVNFHQIADAERALDTMNFTMIKSRPCRIMWSQRDPSLRRSGVGNIFVKNLHESIDNKQLYDTFSLFGNILSCKVVTDKDTGKSMGYGYVHYETAEAANAAIEKLDGMLIDGQEVQVGHFMRRNERPGQSDWTNCYVKNIPIEWDDAALRNEFQRFGEVLSATVAMGVPKFKPKKKPDAPTTTSNDKKEEDKTNDAEPPQATQPPTQTPDENEETTAATNDKKVVSLGYGFVNFAEHASAAQAIEELNGKTYKTNVDGQEVERELYVGRAQKKIERQRELAAKFEALKLEKIAKFQGVNLYVKNLDDSVTDDILRDEFSAMGTITSARVMKDMKDGISRGFGFVCFSTPEEATRAVNEMNGKIIGNKPIFVALAQRKEVRRAQLEAHHSTRGHAQTSQPNAAIMRAPLQAPMGYPTAAMPVYMQRPGPGGSIQPVYPIMPQIMQHTPASNQRSPQTQQPRAYPILQQQRGVYPMPAYGVVPQQPVRGGRGPANQGRGGRIPKTQTQKPVPSAPNKPSQQLKFNHHARNAQPDRTAQPQPPVPQPNESLTASALASASPEMQKNMIGERLYPLIHASQPELAGKITGMLLEMDNSELLHLLESPEALSAKIAEALQVLEAHNAAQAPTGTG